MKQRVSTKMKEFSKEFVLNGENGTQAILATYDTNNPKTASSMAVENLAKPSIQEEIEKIRKTLAERIPDDLLEKKHLELLNKQEVIVKNNNKTGELEVIPTGELDVQAVKAGLDMAYKIKGAYVPEKLPLDDKTNNVYNFFFNQDVRDELETYEGRVKDLLKNAKPPETTEENVEPIKER